MGCKMSYTTVLLYACLLASSEAFEFGQLGTGLSESGNILNGPNVYKYLFKNQRNS